MTRHDLPEMVHRCAGSEIRRRSLRPRQVSTTANVDPAPVLRVSGAQAIFICVEVTGCGGIQPPEPKYARRPCGGSLRGPASRGDGLMRRARYHHLCISNDNRTPGRLRRGPGSARSTFRVDGRGPEQSLAAAAQTLDLFTSVYNVPAS